MRVARPFPFDRLPNVGRVEARMLRRAARVLPTQRLADAARALQDCLGAPVTLQPLPLEHCPAGELGLCVSDPLVAAILEPASPSAAGRIAIELEPRLAAVVIDRVLGGSGEDAPLDPGVLNDVEKGVLGYAFARALAAAAAGVLRVRAVVTAPAALLAALGDGPALCWPARARIGADAGIVRAWIPERALDRDPAGPDVRRAAAFARLNVTVVLESGRAVLSAADVASLAPGDVLVLDEASARPSFEGARGETIARIRGGATRWRCAIEPVGAEQARLVVRAVEIGRPAPRAGAKEDAMGEENEARGEAILRAAGDAPIEIVVELARIEMPLADVAALRPGEVLATGRRIGERVTLRAADRTIALGELVDVEGEVGVRLISLG